MLRMTPCASAAQAMDYFRRALSRGEYYAKGQELDGQEMLGQWGGLAAERLGLAGEVEQQTFNRLCRNRHPESNRSLTPRTKDHRRVGYDLNFHVPKSVSLMLELGGDRRLLGVFREAVTETMTELEADTRTRVRLDGADHSRVSGNLIWAEFTHFTARPVMGEPDPHLHAHCFVFNATHDPVEQRWKAADLGDIKRDMPYFQAAFHSRLADGVAQLGYDIEKTATGWEIAGVPEHVRLSFSRRTEAIEKLATERGVADPERKAALGAATRESKLVDLTMEALRSSWKERLLPGDRDLISRERRAAENAEPRRRVHKDDRDRSGDAGLSLAFATEHAFEHASVIPERRLKAVALEHGVGRVLPDEINEELSTRISRRGVLSKTDDERRWVSTPNVLAEEDAMLETVKRGRGQHDPLRPERLLLDPRLSDEQRDAVKHVLESTDSTILFRGKAGVGKTTVMREVARCIKSTGKTMVATAPTGMATHEVLAKEGFKDARTVAHLLGNTDLQQTLRNGVLWVDEAGLVSVPDMQKLVKLAHRKGARLLLTGDTAQHSSVMRGDAMRLLEQEAGLTPARLTTVRRQQHVQYKEAVQALASGHIRKGFHVLDGMDAIKETVPEEETPLPVQLAKAYAKSLKSGDSTLVISPTHAEGRSVTSAIRSVLKEHKALAQHDTASHRLVPKHLTTAQKQEPRHYEPGDVIEFHQHAKCGFKRGERVYVSGLRDGVLHVRTERGGTERVLGLGVADRFAVYQQSTLPITKGDRVRITKPGRTADGRHRLHTGSIYEVKSLDVDGSLILENDWVVDSRFGHIAHGYCVTSDAAQGRTVDHVILAQSSQSVAASSRQQFYTSVSRGRKRVTIFTDSKEDLLSAVHRDATRVSATEMFGKDAMRGMTPPVATRMAQQCEEAGLWNARRVGQRLKGLYTKWRRREPVRAPAPMKERGRER